MKTFGWVLVFLVSAISADSHNENDISGLIVNGRDADIADFPHHLALIDQGRYFCGASVINRLFALSAAHCLVLNF
jgi:secreted trypsin-like serine protease